MEAIIATGKLPAFLVFYCELAGVQAILYVCFCTKDGDNRATAFVTNPNCSANNGKPAEYFRFLLEIPAMTG